MGERSETRWVAEHHSGRRVEFSDYAEALRFVLRRGEASELWTLSAALSLAEGE